MNRNAGPPTFNPETYPVAINEDYPTGENLAIITLRDPDGDVCNALLFFSNFITYVIQEIFIRSVYDTYSFFSNLFFHLLNNCWFVKHTAFEIH